MGGNELHATGDTRPGSAHLPTARDAGDVAADTATPPTAIEGAALPPRDRERTLAKGELLGRYVVLDRIGAGGMGVVYSAYDPDLNRRVAVKLVRARSGIDHARQARLLREAQALARLQHPNVVALYDVGSFGGRLFLAMELVDGQTLSGWLAAGKRSWRDVVAVFIAAGQGLAAAHDKQLIHRDFKPGNVLVGADGRVRVTDFGLARGDHGEDVDVEWDEDQRQAATPRSLGPVAAETAPDGLSRRPAGSSRDILDQGLTRAGSVMGTPAYMAPETYRGEAGPATDQFAFAVSLYEAIYGQPPFDAKAEGAARWAVPKPPAGSAVPGWLHKLVLRGISIEPAARFASMADFVAGLSNDPGILRRRVAIGAGAVLVVGAGVAFALTWPDADEQRCQGGEQKLVGIWDAARKSTVQQALARTSTAGRDLWPYLEPALDDYATDWAAMHKAACLATRATGEQSEEVLTLRMTCLERRRVDLEALSAVLATPTIEQASHAMQSAQALPPVSYCGDVEALRAPVPPPADPALRTKADAVYKQLAGARAADDHDQLDRVLEAADQLGWAPLEAEAAIAVCVAANEINHFDRATVACDQAVVAALAADDDRTLFRAHLVRVEILSAQRSFDLARKELAYADALAERFGDDHARSDLVDAHAKLESLAGNEVAATLAAELIRIRERPGFLPSELAGAYYTAAWVGMNLSRYDETLPLLAKAAELWRTAEGPTSRHLGDVMHMTGSVHGIRDRIAEGISATAQALAIHEAHYGPDDVTVAADLLNLGANLAGVPGRLDEARAHFERALPIFRAKYGPKGYWYALITANLGGVEASAGRLDAAVEHLSASLAAFNAAPEAPKLRMAVFYSLAATYARQGRQARALDLLAHGIVVPQDASLDAAGARMLERYAVGLYHLDYGSKPTAVATLRQAVALAAPLPAEMRGRFEPVKDLARAYLETGRAKQARTMLEELVAAPAPTPLFGTDLTFRFDVRFLLARALVATGGDRARIADLAREALAAYDRMPPHDQKDQHRQQTVDAWLVRHPDARAAAK